MPLPNDLPPTIELFNHAREQAAAKYEPLVRRLGSMEFLGLVLATERELERRSKLYHEDDPKPRDPGTRLGNR